MTILFSGTVTVTGGNLQTSSLPVPGNIKQPGVPLNLVFKFDEATFPAGTTTITAQLSMDGGSTWRSASMTCVNPKTDWRGAAPHFWQLGFTLGANENPTHARALVSAPAQFNLSGTIEAV
jgi:hypothetical protein